MKKQFTGRFSKKHLKLGLPDSLEVLHALIVAYNKAIVQTPVTKPKLACKANYTNIFFRLGCIAQSCATCILKCINPELHLLAKNEHDRQEIERRCLSITLSASSVL